MTHDRDAEDTRLLEASDHAALLAAYYPVIRERCRLRLSAHDADEVAHRVVDRLLGELKRGKRYSVSYRVVVQMVIEWKLKEHFAGRTTFLLPEGWDPEGPDPYAGFEDRYDFEILIADLPEKSRRVVMLRYQGGLEIEDIAKILGMERNAVDQALYRGRIAILEKIGG
jgi:RNA polymerase sigma factor (sigma-70 family)